MSWVEVQFLQQAVDTLQKSRQILMFTYVFAFYLQRSNPTDIFEQNQVIKTQFAENLILRRIWSTLQNSYLNIWSESCPTQTRVFPKLNV